MDDFFALFIFNDGFAAIESSGSFEIARNVLAGCANRILGFKELFEVLAFDMMPTVYEIGEHAECILRELGHAEEKARTFLSGSAHRQFAHSLAICECLASIEFATRQRPDVRLVSWPEVLAKAPESTRTSVVPFRVPTSSAGGAVQPDGFFALEYRSEAKKAYRFFALEVDRGTMPVQRTNEKQTSYLAKLAMYLDVITRQLHKSYLGIPNLFVLTVTMDRTRLDDIMRKFGESAGAQALFLFKAIGMGTGALNMPMPQLLLEPWDRTEQPSLRIDK